MIIKEKSIKLKNGATCILRNPKMEDATKMIDFLKVTATETNFLVKYPEEVNITIEQEEGILQWFNESERDLMIIAEVDGEVMGNCSFGAVGKKMKIRHRCAMGIALYEKAWGLGIGTALLELLIESAKEYGYEQMELEVVARNERAIALYENLGFEKYGVVPNAMKYKDGTYDDRIVMAKML